MSGFRACALIGNIIKNNNIEVNPDMGKGNRSRIERAMADSNTAVQAKAKKNKVSGAGIFVSIAAVLVVVALLIGCISMINEGGWFARSQTVVKTENYKVTGTMMNYFFMTQFNSYYEYYNQMYQSYFGSTGTGSALELMGIDGTKSFKDQYMESGAEGAEKVTVFDYYMSLTEDYVTRVLTYCEYADDLGIELTDEDIEEIEHSIEHLKENYESTKELYTQLGAAYYSSFSAYLSASYGTGVNEKDMIECMKLTTLAAKVEEKMTDDMKAEIRGEEGLASIEQFVKDNPASFLMADYYAYSFSVNNKGLTDAEFEAEKAEILEQAKALAAVEGKDAYKAAVLELLKETELKSYRDKNWATILAENENDEALAEEALNKKFNEEVWNESMQELKFGATLTTEYKYPATATDLSKWVFGYTPGEDAKEDEKAQEAAKPGDTTYIELNTEKEETVLATGTTAESTTDTGSTTTEKIKVKTYTVTVYLLDKETYRDTTETEKFGYALFTTKADAETFLAALKEKETKDLDALIETLNDLHEEVTVNSYNALENYVLNTLKDDQSIEGVDSWLESAKAGDVSEVTEVVKTTISKDKDGKDTETKTTYYAVMVYEGEGDQAWLYTALMGATNEALTEWYEANGLDLTYNEKAYKYINI